MNKGKDSKWYKYLRMIPRDYSHIAYKFDVRKYRRYLEGTAFIKTVKRELEMILLDYKKVKSALPYETRKMTWNSYFNLFLYVRSRGFGVKINGTYETLLVPYVGKLPQKIQNFRIFNFLTKTNLSVFT